MHAVSEKAHSRIRTAKNQAMLCLAEGISTCINRHFNSIKIVGNSKGIFESITNTLKLVGFRAILLMG